MFRPYYPVLPLFLKFVNNMHNNVLSLQSQILLISFQSIKVAGFERVETKNKTPSCNCIRVKHFINNLKERLKIIFLRFNNQSTDQFYICKCVNKSQTFTD